MAGDLLVDGRVAIGNDAKFSDTSNWDYPADLSYTVDTFPKVYSSCATGPGATERPSVRIPEPHDLERARR